MASDFGQHIDGWRFTLERLNMDVQQHRQDRVYSILNDNDSPSFQIKKTSTSPSPRPQTQRLPSIASLTSYLPRLERPSLLKYPQYHRNNSISSASSPPLLRFDSSSSTKSSNSSSMDSTPSPMTPAYNFNDNGMVPYDNILRQDLAANYLPSPTGITPFIEQGMIIGPVPGQEAFLSKGPAPPLAPAAYPIIPAANDMVQMPTPSLSTDASVSSTSSANPPTQTSPTNTTSNTTATGKKNKYPCPYAQSHNCSAAFTTSGHAARHGKKHTGEKGVHCPICDKAFTRKDNMKQHERTHKNRPNNTDGEEKKSKAQATRDAQKVKAVKQEPALPQLQTQTQTSQPPAHMRKASSGLSNPSDVTLAPNPVDTPDDISPAFFPDTHPQIVLPADTGLTADPALGSMYPPLGEDAMLSAATMPLNDKLEQLPVPQPPTLVRGFSDLDTLAQAAESAFDPYFQQGQFS